MKERMEVKVTSIDGKQVDGWVCVRMDGSIAAVGDKRFYQKDWQSDRGIHGRVKGSIMNKWKEEEEGRYNFEKSERKEEMESF